MVKIPQKIADLRDRGAWLQFDITKAQEAKPEPKPNSIDSRFGNYCIGFDAGYMTKFVEKSLHIAKLEETINAMAKQIEIANDTVKDLIKLHEKYVTEDQRQRESMINLRLSLYHKAMARVGSEAERSPELDKIQTNNVINLAALLMGANRGG